MGIHKRPAQHPGFVKTFQWYPRSLLQQFEVVRRAMMHPYVPWYAKLVAGFSVCYVLSPIQFLPNFIPVVGQLDDVLVVTSGLKLLKRWVLPEVLAECGCRATIQRIGDVGACSQGSAPMATRNTPQAP
jgi:uncharacterized membrane protein YkvA (DUF1232 family)